MTKQFYSSKEASKITGCTPRQLEYWRKRGVVVPTIDTEGSGYNVYYSLSELWQLTVMNYLQEIGLDFKICCQILNQLRKREPELLQNPLSVEGKRFMLSKEEMILTNFNTEEAQKAIQRGESVLSFWTENINQRLLEGLNMILSSKKKPLLLMTK